MATYWENSCSFGLRYVSWYGCLVVGLVFSHLGFWSGNLFLIAPFPDLCLLVPFYTKCQFYLAIFLASTYMSSDSCVHAILLHRRLLLSLILQVVYLGWYTVKSYRKLFQMLTNISNIMIYKVYYENVL